MKKRRVIVEDGIVAGNAYDKYGTRNPVARALMRNFLYALRRLVQQAANTDVHEVGCGEGHLSLELKKLGAEVRGSDFSRQVISRAEQNAECAGLQVAFKVASIYDLTPGEDAAGLVVCCEVLEHLSDAERALQILTQLARPHLLISVPREPIWRLLNMARGKYLTALGNTPGHVNHWSRGSFLRFLRQHVDIVEVRSPFPWTMALCRSRELADKEAP